MWYRWVPFSFSNCCAKMLNKGHDWSSKQKKKDVYIYVYTHRQHKCLFFLLHQTIRRDAVFLRMKLMDGASMNPFAILILPLIFFFFHSICRYTYNRAKEIWNIMELDYIPPHFAYILKHRKGFLFTNQMPSAPRDRVRRISLTFSFVIISQLKM